MKTNMRILTFVAAACLVGVCLWAVVRHTNAGGSPPKDFAKAATDSESSLGVLDARAPTAPVRSQDSKPAVATRSKPAAVQPGDLIPLPSPGVEPASNSVDAGPLGKVASITTPLTDAEKELCRKWWAPDATWDRVRKVFTLCAEHHLRTNEIVELLGPPFFISDTHMQYRPWPSMLPSFDLDSSGRAIKADP